MSSGKPPLEGKDLPTTLAKQRKLPILGRLGEKGVSYVILNNPSLFLFLNRIAFHLILPLIIIWPKNSSFPAKAGEKPMVFQLFEPNFEKRLIFQLFQHFHLFQPEWTPCVIINSEHLSVTTKMSQHVLFIFVRILLLRRSAVTNLRSRGAMLAKIFA